MNETDEEEKITVNKVCQDFRVREDGALATKLQEEEFQKHYCMNRSERQSVRSDVRVAKQTYLEEIRTAQLLPEDELSKMEETDKWLARDLQDKLHEEERREIMQQQEIESHDAKIAKQMQRREKEKFDREWRRKKQLAEEERRHLQSIEDKETFDRERRRRKAPEEEEEERRRLQSREDKENFDRERRRRLAHEEDEDERRRLQSREDKEHFDRERRRRKAHEENEEEERRRLQSREDKEHFDRERRRRLAHEEDEDERRRLQSREDKEHFDRERRRRKAPEEEEEERRRLQSREDKEHFDRERRRKQAQEEEEERRGLQSREEKETFEREFRRKKAREEEERRHLQQTMEELSQSEGDSRRRPANQVSEPIPINGHADGVSRRVRRTNSKEDKRRSTESGSSGGSVGKEERRQKHSPDYGSGAVVALPSPENGGGGRLESDRIIMADGTAIDLFDNEEDREKARKLQRIKKDEQYAKMLQDQERRIVAAEKMAAEDRRIAMEEQDRELARHLQRKEYQRLKREQKERQMQRANSVPSDRHSMSIEDPRRLPSYEEAVHRNQMPDLLPSHDFDPENLHERDRNQSPYSSTHSSRRTASRSPPLERRTTNPEKAERREYAREDGRLTSRGPSSVDHRRSAPIDDRRADRDHSRSNGRDYKEDRAPSPTRNGHSSRDYRTEKEHHEHDDKESPVWLTRDSICSSNSPPRERRDYQESNRSSYASSGQSSCDRRSQTTGHAGSPSSRGDVWERFDDESFEEARYSRPSRSRTVPSSNHYERERPKSYNVVENIDPTFKRERKSSEDDPKDQNPEEKAKVIPLIKPHRRKSAERKRDRHMDKENCKQQ